MKLMNIGFGNMISAQRLLAVVSPDAAPTVPAPVKPTLR